jgi:hypothetical protein
MVLPTLPLGLAYKHLAIGIGVLLLIVALVLYFNKEEKQEIRSEKAHVEKGKTEAKLEAAVKVNNDVQIAKEIEHTPDPVRDQRLCNKYNRAATGC